MSTYKEIRGKLVKRVTIDPTPATNHEGEMWYNTTTGALKVAQGVASAWSSGPTSSSPAVGGMVGFGAQTAAVLAGGLVPAPSPALQTAINVVQEYDGSSWTTVNAMSQVRLTFGGAGPQTSGVVFGGRISGNPFTYTAVTEEYDGTNWSSGGAMGATRYYMGAAGTQTAALSFGGLQGGPTSKEETEEYNGSAWTAGGDLVTANHAGRGSGTQTAALGASAAPPAPKTVTQEYNGSSWTSANSANTSSAYRGVSSLGTQTSSLLWGGEPFTSATESYDGTNWTVEGATLSVPRSEIVGGVGGTTGLAFGRESPAGTPANTATEEFTAAYIGAKIVTSS